VLHVLSRLGFSFIATKLQKKFSSPNKWEKK